MTTGVSEGAVVGEGVSEEGGWGVSVLAGCWVKEGGIGDGDDVI